MIVPIVLGFYFFVCISVILFNCWKVLSGKLVRKRHDAQKRRYRQWFMEGGRRTPRQMARGLRRNGSMLAFHAAMDEMEAEQPERFAERLPLLAQILQGAFPYYAGRSNMKRAYYTYLLARFQVMRYAPSEQITAFLLEQIREKRSLYNLENALRVVYSSNQIPLALTALRLLDSDSEIFIHEKLLVDGLLTFEDRDGLIAALWEHFPNYGVHLQELLLDYIRFASGAWQDEMLALAQSEPGLEIKIACLRYFGKYPDERARSLLYPIAQDADGAQWELCAVCMTALAAYPGEETVNLLKRGLRSRNWYVRYNAALSLRALHVGEEQLQDILCGDDRYAKEMLQYRLGLSASGSPIGAEAAKAAQQAHDQAREADGEAQREQEREAAV